MPVSAPKITYKNPIATCYAFGRFFYAVDSTVYYSKVVITGEDAGKCFQVNDPISENISDLLDTDGGVLDIEEARTIRALSPFRNGVVVFATNGVWYINNPDGGFKATAYNIEKISERGIETDRSIVEAEGVLFYISNNGIMQVTPNEFNVLSTKDITEDTIRSYFISNIAGQDYRGVYNESRKQVEWWGRRGGIIYDLRLQAFYPQQNASPTAQLGQPFTIINAIYYPFYFESSGAVSYSFAFPNNDQFKDFGRDQVAYIITGEETLGKFANKKSITQATVYFNKTETQITAYVNGEYVFDKPSSCLFQARWDFDISDAYNQYIGNIDGEGKGQVMQLYKPMRRGFIPTEFPYTFNTGESKISNKFNIRGTGDSVRFVFKAEPEKDLQLLGYSVSYTMRGRM